MTLAQEVFTSFIVELQDNLGIEPVRFAPCKTSLASVDAQLRKGSEQSDRRSNIEGRRRVK